MHTLIFSNLWSNFRPYADDYDDVDGHRNGDDATQETGALCWLEVDVFSGIRSLWRMSQLINGNLNVRMLVCYAGSGLSVSHLF